MSAPWTTPSQGQQRLWIAEEMASEGVYNVPVGLRMQGDLNEGALLTAIHGIVSRHESLRCLLRLDDEGRLSCVIQEPASFGVEQVDLTGIDDATDRLAEFAVTFSRRRFVLAGEVLRIAMVRMAARDYVLLVVGHHVVFDDWGVALFFRELEVGYAAACQGSEPDRLLPPLDHGYAELAAAEQSGINSGYLERQTAYWSDRLAGALPCELPLDRPRPIVPTGSGVPLFFSMPDPFGTHLMKIGREHGATGFMTAVAVFHALLRRRTGREDITVGTPVSGRTSAERERLIINMVNIIAIRSQLPGKPRFVDLLGEVRNAVLGAFANQDAPLGDALGRLRARNPQGRPADIRLLFELQNTDSHMGAFLGVTDDLPVFAGLHTSAYLIPDMTVRYDLEMKIAVTGSGRLEGLLVYSPDIFEEDTMRALIDEFQAIIRAVVRDPFIVTDEAQLSMGDG
ncbi:condensation domain-containing protein [Actinomadura roseirufa]|uniref:condensation domain-containing protein n=1 Tax=Actinomadura roseirufa TaxID=2094049 RepID=UPI00241509F3|nr:condensation domain-containing protein [Actinomadura roseirufa]